MKEDKELNKRFKELQELSKENLTEVEIQVNYNEVYIILNISSEDKEYLFNKYLRTQK